MASFRNPNESWHHMYPTSGKKIAILLALTVLGIAANTPMGQQFLEKIGILTPSEEVDTLFVPDEQNEGNPFVQKYLEDGFEIRKGVNDNGNPTALIVEPSGEITVVELGAEELRFAN